VAKSGHLRGRQHHELRLAQSLPIRTEQPSCSIGWRGRTLDERLLPAAYNLMMKLMNWLGLNRAQLDKRITARRPSDRENNPTSRLEQMQQTSADPCLRGLGRPSLRAGREVSGRGISGVEPSQPGQPNGGGKKGERRDQLKPDGSRARPGKKQRLQSNCRRTPLRVHFSLVIRHDSMVLVLSTLDAVSRECQEAVRPRTAKALRGRRGQALTGLQRLTLTIVPSKGLHRKELSPVSSAIATWRLSRTGSD
jgi:hypothetical protein